MTQPSILQSVITFCNLSEAIGAILGRRITIDTIPDGQPLPYATVRQITGSQSYTTTDEGSRRILVQFDVYGSSIEDADNGAESIRSTFSNYRGAVGEVTTGRCVARQFRGSWNPTARSFQRIVEVEIPTND